MMLFLDFDGVLHPNEAFMTKTGVVLRCDGHNLFEHAELLADLLEPYPTVKIMLSTSWVWTLNFKKAKARLPDLCKFTRNQRLDCPGRQRYRMAGQ
ncbi:MAG: HAD domain-containing protein [Gallionella sp.]|nr:HAD domain-containing protein [Gallionella sp.]